MPGPRPATASARRPTGTPADRWASCASPGTTWSPIRASSCTEPGTRAWATASGRRPRPTWTTPSRGSRTAPSTRRRGPGRSMRPRRASTPKPSSAASGATLSGCAGSSARCGPRCRPARRSPSAAAPSRGARTRRASRSTPAGPAPATSTSSSWASRSVGLWVPDAQLLGGINTLPLSDEAGWVAPALDRARRRAQAIARRPVSIQAMAGWFLDLRTLVQGQPYVVLNGDM